MADQAVDRQPRRDRFDVGLGFDCSELAGIVAERVSERIGETVLEIAFLVDADVSELRMDRRLASKPEVPVQETGGENEGDDTAADGDQGGAGTPALPNGVAKGEGAGEGENLELSAGLSSARNSISTAAARSQWLDGRPKKRPGGARPSMHRESSLTGCAGARTPSR